MTTSLGHGHIPVLVYIPYALLLGSKAGYVIPEVSCLDGGLRWSRFPSVHLTALPTAGHRPYHTALLQLPHLFQAPFFAVVCLQRWIYIHIP